MGLKTIWSNYRVLIVMGTGLALVHWGWYNIKSNPVFHPKRDEEFVPEPVIVTYVLEQEKKAKGK